MTVANSPTSLTFSQLQARMGKTPAHGSAQRHVQIGIEVCFGVLAGVPFANAAVGEGFDGGDGLRQWSGMGEWDGSSEIGSLVCWRYAPDATGSNGQYQCLGIEHYGAIGFPGEISGSIGGGRARRSPDFDLNGARSDRWGSSGEAVGLGLAGVLG